tara:strand:- start:1537 stop:3291 length:1755 start_codon:yes stop_codon:yes gene_type:complete
MANKSVGLLTIAFGADLRGFDKAMKKAQRSIKKFGASMQRTGQNLTRNLTVPLVGLGIAAVKMASDYEESLNKVKVSFGDTSKSVEDFAKTTLKSFGIAEGSALEMASLFGDMGTSMGLTQTSAAKMSISMVGLAGDLASFKNIRIDIARTALASVFTGETESLKKLGIVMTEANLKQFALEQGITKTIKQMSQAEKVQLRYNFVVSKSSNAMGDYARTSDGVANSTRNLQESFKELGEKFGKLLIPEAKNLIKQLQIIIDQFSNLTTEQKENLIFWGKVIAVVGPLIAILGLLAGAISSIIGLFAGLSASAVAAVMSAIGLSAIYVYEQFQKFKTAKKHVDNLTGSVKELKDITDKMAGFTWKGTFGEQKKEFSTFGDVKITPENKKEDNTEKRILGITKKMVSLKSVLLDTGRTWRTYYKNIEESSSMTAEAQKELNAATKLFGDVMFNSMMNAANSQEGFFTSFVENMKKAIKQLLIQLAVMTVINLLLGGKGFSLGEAFSNAKTSILGLASGGLVTGPTMALVGEGAGTTASNPEVVAPLDKLKGMIGGGSQKVEVYGRISGNDIFISNQRGTLNRLRSV